MMAEAKSGSGRTVRGLFVALYLMVQICIPIVGLYLAHRAEAPVRFSWHMFSRVPDVDDE